MPTDFRELQDKCDKEIALMEAQEEAKRLMELANAAAAANGE